MLKILPFGLRYSDIPRADTGQIGLDTDQLLWLRVGQRTQQRRVYHAKNRSGRSNAEGNRQNGDRGEAGRFPKHPQTEAEVLEENVNKIAGDRIAAFLFESRFSAELDPRAAVCLGASQSETFKVLSAQLDMRPQLLFQIVLGLGTTEKSRR